jgi:hypothetical protein
MAMIEFARRGPVAWRSPCVLDKSELVSIVLEVDEMFPGYDAIWITEGADPVSVQDRLMYHAAERPGRLPRRPAVNEAVEWSEVELWMKDHRVVAGVVSAFHSLTIERFRV